MAQYGYSAGYQGGGPSAVPSGFIESYAQAGRNIGAGIQQIGSAIGESLARYGQNKAESEFLTQRLESLAPYLQTVAQSGNVMDENSPESKVLADIKKFGTMSTPQKKAALLNAEFFLDRLDKQKARELQDLQVAQLKNQIQTQQQAGELMRYGLTMPTTQTVTEPTTEMLQPVGPVQPDVTAAPPVAPSGPSQAEATAARYFMGRFGQAAQDLAKYGSDLGKQAAALNVSPVPRFTGPIVLGQEDNAAYLAQQFESPIAAAARAEANTRLKERQLAESSAALQQAGIMRNAPPLRTAAVQAAPTATPQQPAAQFLPPIEVQGQATRTEAVPYEQLRQNLAKYASQQGMNPEVYAGLDRVLEIAGQRKPTTVEQVGDLGAVVKFGDKEQFVPAPKQNIDDLLKIKGMTIDFPEFKGTAPSAKEAEAFREQYSNLLTSRRDLGRLIEIANMGKGTQQTPQIKAEADQLARTVQGAMRLDILGPGTVTDSDRKLLESIVRNPTDVFSLSSSNKKALEGLLSRATNGITTRAQSLGLQVMAPQQLKQAQGGKVMRYNPVTKRIE